MTSRQRRQGEAIDAASVRERLARLLRATEAVGLPSREDTVRILESRARALARPQKREGPATGAIDVVIFTLASETYAIEMTLVREVTRLADLTAIPGAPEFLAGVTNHRGEILAVIDLRRLFAIPSKGLTDLSRLIVLGRERAEFGVLAEAVKGAVTLDASELRSQMEPMAGIDRGFLKGVTKEAVIVLDAAALLGDARLFVDQDDTPAQRAEGDAK
jgi:purine-binding chemotaxis protein CheW